MVDKKNKMPWIPDYTIKDAKIRWRNFAGREEKFNAKGNRNFTIFLTPEDAATLSEQGLNVKTLPQREEGDTQTDFLKVKVNFNRAVPPRLILVTHKGRTPLGEDEAMLLDLSEIKKVDLIISPYWWYNDDDTPAGVAVSLKAIYMTIVEDELEMAYSDLPEATGSLRGRDYTPFDNDEDRESSGVHFE